MRKRSLARSSTWTTHQGCYVQYSVGMAARQTLGRHKTNNIQRHQGCDVIDGTDTNNETHRPNILLWWGLPCTLRNIFWFIFCSKANTQSKVNKNIDTFLNGYKHKLVIGCMKLETVRTVKLVYDKRLIIEGLKKWGARRLS